ncbi:hypothetical protein BB560_006929 [Smittium megazygosporum]|uniref:Retrotransposon gag domain-containing protein n=1 Tax=Smittium megazygosporum TaxID=133381 RepID=A0A2T9Y096_9FUNG|nr:hypothetical protein BB560_006929 [Smittium megazygosporum]
MTNNLKAKSFSGLERSPDFVIRWIASIKTEAANTKLSETEGVYFFNSKMRGIAAEWVSKVEIAIPNSISWSLKEWLKAMEVRFGYQNTVDTVRSKGNVAVSFQIKNPKPEKKYS